MRDHFAIFLKVIKDGAILNYSNWTILGPREDVPATLLGFGSLYCDGEYIALADIDEATDAFVRGVIRSVVVSPEIVADWQSKLEAASKASLLKTDPVLRHQQTWLKLASTLGLPEVMLVVGRRVDNAQTTATLYCGPTFDPSKQLRKLQQNARAALRTRQQRRSN